MNIVITGATKGIGRATAELFAEKGFNLAINARTSNDLEAFAQDLQKRFPTIQVLHQATDMGKKEEVISFANMVWASWGEVDILLNNAGVFLQTNLSEGDDDAFTGMMNVNLYSAYYLTKALLPAVKKAKGHVMNMCSIASIMPYGTYSVSKFALLGYSKVLREELKEEQVRVTAILPGATYTASWDGSDLPEERFMKADDIAHSVWDAWNMSKRTVVEEIILRPQLGDI